MKKQKRGFTLVELLAVMAILSIITGISVPVATSVVGNSKYNALMTIVDSAEDYIANQWRIKKIDSETMSDNFEKALDRITTSDKLNEFVRLSVDDDYQRMLIEEMGISSIDVSTVAFKIDTDEIPCVVIVDIPVDSSFYNIKYWNKINLSGVEKIVPDYTVKGGNHSFYSKCCVYDDVQKYLNELNR